MKKKIAHDADDSLINTITPFLEFHNHKYGTNFTIDDCTSFDLANILGKERAEVLDNERLFYESHFNQKIQATEGAHYGIEHLSKDYGNFVITGRGIDVEKHTLNTLTRIFDFNHFKEVHHTGTHGGFGQRMQKWQLCKKLGIPLLIDDYHGHLLLAAENNIHGILFTKPWNKNITDLPRLVYRAENWYEAVEIIEKKKEIIFG